MSFDKSTVPEWVSQQSKVDRLKSSMTKCVFDIPQELDPEKEIVGRIFEMSFPPNDGSKVSFYINNKVMSFEVDMVELLVRSKGNEDNLDLTKKILLGRNNDVWSFVYVIKLKEWD